MFCCKTDGIVNGDHNWKSCSSYFLALFVILLVWSVNEPCSAQIYKWKDERGKWHFGDKPPAKQKSAEVVKGSKKRTSSPSKSSLASSDLKARLYEKYKPRSPVEEATLGVVTIETPMGNGSGFFLTEDGYILTNRHVVRFTDTHQWQEIQNRVSELGVEFKSAKANLAVERIPIKELEEKAKIYKKAIHDEGSSTKKKLLTAEYKSLKQQLSAKKKIYSKLKTFYQKKKREFDKAKSDFNWKSNAARVANNFKIILKDKTSLRARLIVLSKKNDLALLRLNGYKTPSLQAADLKILSQGMTVFAIGSPLGFRDAVTSGVVTRIDKNYIATDAQILPGSSGGPLITKDGRVVGVNTVKLYDLVSDEGFGIAISIETANREFKKFLNEGG